jgi:polyhydroxyalkanoate synthesis regulator phasin
MADDSEAEANREEAGPYQARNEASLQAFRDAVEKSVAVSRERLQEVVDDAVRRGRMTRGDAEEMVGRLVSQVREQAEELLSQVEPLISNSAVSKARRDVESRVRSTARKARKRAK